MTLEGLATTASPDASAMVAALISVFEGVFMNHGEDK